MKTAVVLAAGGVVGQAFHLGVLGALAGMIGSLMAMEVVREIVGFGEGLVGRLLVVDALSLRFETLGYGWDPANPLNGTMSPSGSGDAHR